MKKRTYNEIESILNIGRRFIDLGAYDNCYKLCDLLLRENSRLDNVWALYGVACAKDGHLDLAQECFLTSLSIKDSNYVLANYIQTHLELGNFEFYLKAVGKFYMKLEPPLKEMILTNILMALSCKYLFRDELPEIIKEDLDNIHIL